MTWYHAVLALSAAVGCAAVAQGSRAAIPLLASFFLSLGMCAAGMPFNLAMWMLIDIMCGAAIIVSGALRNDMSPRDILILGLFVPAWTFYPSLPDDPAATAAVMAIVLGQFCVAFRWKEGLAWGTGKVKGSGKPPGMMRVRYA